MTRALILKRIIEELRDNVLVIHSWTLPVTEETHLINDLALSSMEFVNLTFGVEELFAFEVDTDETDTWATMGNVVDTVERFFGS